MAATRIRRIRDPVHGFILYDDNELKIIESPYFQRLRGIKLLALTYLVYPGAMHTRFEHSLGVMEMASRAFDALRQRQEDDLKKNFRRIGLKVQDARQLLRLTALLHDTGHLPFSHAAEGIIPKGKDHEDVSVAVVNSLRRTLDRTFYRGISTHISVLIQKNTMVPPELQILKRLISSQLDVDRADYLLRDSLHCGVEYGNFDYRRLFEMLRLIDGPEGGLELAIDRGGIHSLEALILARYYMFAQVYFHKVRRIYDLYLTQYMKSWSRAKLSSNLMSVVKYDDQDVHASMVADSKNSRSRAREFARRILNREHQKLIWESSEFADAAEKGHMALLHRELQGRYQDTEFVFDTGADGPIHKFYVRGDEIQGDEFRVVTAYGSGPVSLTRESTVIEKLPKRFAIYRIYAHGTPGRLAGYRAFSKKRWQELRTGG